MSEIDSWHGPVLKKYIDEDKIEEKDIDDCPTITRPSMNNPLTKEEMRELKEKGESKKFVTDDDGNKHLRHSIVRDEVALDIHQVFIEQTSDGREKDRIHFVEGKTKEEGLTELDISDSSILVHIGSVREYLEKSDELSYNLSSLTSIPSGLMGYNYRLSQAYQDVVS